MCGKAFFLRPDRIFLMNLVSRNAALNAVVRDDGDSGEWQDWLVDESPDKETTLAARKEFDILALADEGADRSSDSCCPARET